MKVRAELCDEFNKLLVDVSSAAFDAVDYLAFTAVGIVVVFVGGVGILLLLKLMLWLWRWL